MRLVSSYRHFVESPGNSRENEMDFHITHRIIISLKNRPDYGFGTVRGSEGRSAVQKNGHIQTGIWSCSDMDAERMAVLSFFSIRDGSPGPFRYAFPMHHDEISPPPLEDPRGYTFAYRLLHDQIGGSYSTDCRWEEVVLIRTLSVDNSD